MVSYDTWTTITPFVKLLILEVKEMFLLSANAVVQCFSRFNLTWLECSQLTFTLHVFQHLYPFSTYETTPGVKCPLLLRALCSSLSWKQSSKGPPSDEGAGALHLQAKARTTRIYNPKEEKYQMGGCLEDWARLFLVVLSEAMGMNRNTGKLSQCLTQVAQRFCGVSILGWTQFWAGCSSWPCLSSRAGPGDLQRSLPTPTIMNSVIQFFSSVMFPTEQRVIKEHTHKCVHVHMCVRIWVCTHTHLHLLWPWTILLGY